ncbi:MAG: hypothetical protein ACK5MH_08760 [Bacteroidales bacterium]
MIIPKVDSFYHSYIEKARKKSEDVLRFDIVACIAELFDTRAHYSMYINIREPEKITKEKKKDEEEHEKLFNLSSLRYDLISEIENKFRLLLENNLDTDDLEKEFKKKFTELNYKNDLIRLWIEASMPLLTTQKSYEDYYIDNPATYPLFNNIPFFYLDFQFDRLLCIDRDNDKKIISIFEGLDVFPKKNLPLKEIDVIDFLYELYIVDVKTRRYIKRMFDDEIKEFLEQYIIYNTYRYYYYVLLSKKAEKTLLSNQRDTLKSKVTQDELKRIYNELKIRYIDCSLELFLACFGYETDKHSDFIIWKESKVQFDIFIQEIVEKVINPKNDEYIFPRSVIKCWFRDKDENEIKKQKRINNAHNQYPIYKIIHPN